MPVSSSGRLQLDHEDSFSLVTATTTASNNSLVVGAAAEGAAAVGLPLTTSSEQLLPPSGNSSVSTTTNSFPNNNNSNHGTREAGDNQQQQSEHEGDDGDDEEGYDFSKNIHDTQRRISHALPTSTETVHELFGLTVGPCWGDYPCSNHNRIRGRLYATSCAILFYTNLLGFERRVCLLLTEVIAMSLFRSTSLKIQTCDGETYIFKSFSDRERVLHLLHGLKILADKQQQQEQHHQEQQQQASSSLHSHPSPSSATTTPRISGSNNNSTRRSLHRSLSYNTGSKAMIVSEQRRLERLSENHESWTSAAAAAPIATAVPLTTTAANATTTTATSSFTSLTGPFNVPLSPANTSLSAIPSPAPPTTTCTTTTSSFTNRRRSVSDSVVRLPRVDSRDSIEHPIPLSEPLDQSFLNASNADYDFDSSIVENDEYNDVNNSIMMNHDDSYPSLLAADDAENDDDLLQKQQERLSFMWKQAKASHSTPNGDPLQEVGIDSVTLSPCSLDLFFQQFLSDKGKYSMDWFQREYIQDKNVQITAWKRNASDDTDNATTGARPFDSQQQDDSDIVRTFQRTMTFIHPINTSAETTGDSLSTSSSFLPSKSSLMGMVGPSAAETTRHQHLQCFPGLGMILTNKTLVKGIPACDTFYVQDKWIVEVVPPQKQQQQQQQIRLSVRFEPHFTKRSLLKPIVQKSVRKETKDWMAVYVDMLQGVIQDLAAAAQQQAAKNSNSTTLNNGIAQSTRSSTKQTSTSTVERQRKSNNDSSALSSVAAAATPAAVVKPATAPASANKVVQQQQPPQDNVLFVKSLQRLVVLVMALVILLCLLVVFQLVALQATLSTLQLQVQGVYVQNAMVMHQLLLERQQPAITLVPPQQMQE